MQNHPKIVILMSTYNGARFLKDQIESLFLQTYTNWLLLVRDDGSTDNTVNILDNYCKMDERIVLNKNKTGNLGPKNSFSYLVGQARKYTDINYFMFCDQDDVWLPSKIELTLKHMLTAETQYSSTKPILLHTDLIVTDEKLAIIYPSFLKLHNLTS